jgi:prepilin-type N-terminal cleavage/methylation domain-containing protein
MKLQRGFTLIEVLVVLVIIAMLVSMAAINTGGDPRKDQLIAEAERLKFFLEAVSDEALFQNKDLGFEITKSNLTPYSYEDVVDPNATNTNSSSNAATNASVQMKKEWVAYKGRFTDVFELPSEDMQFNLKVDGQEVILGYSQEKKEDEEAKPHIHLLSSGEQSVSSIEIYIDDLDFSTTTRGTGVGRYYVDMNHNE